MKKLMLQKKAAGNPCGVITLGNGHGVITDADREYAEKHGWRAVSLTQDEYYGTDVCDQIVIESALDQIEYNRKEMDSLRKHSRKVAAFAAKVAAEVKNKPKGTRGKKKTKR